MSTPPDDAGLGLFSGSDDGNGDDRSRGSSRKRRGPRVLLITLLSVVVLALVAAGLYAYTIDRSVRDNIRRAANLPAMGAAVWVHRA